MATLPDQVLGWLYNNLKTSYRDPDRAYSDIVQTLSQYPTLQPRTEVYTFENGASALLLVLRGTVPVAFRGATYRYPISAWVPYAFPQEAPMVIIAPTQEMVVRPGQHVSVDGRVYHPYLANWQGRWDASNLPTLLEVMKDIFSKEPPVMARQQGQAGQQASRGGPPPVPPPPPHSQNQQQYSQRSSSISQQGPPPPPPKPGASNRTVAAGSPRPSEPSYASRGPPPLPSKPGQASSGTNGSYTPGSQYAQSHAHNRGSSLSGPLPPPFPHDPRQPPQSMPGQGQRFDLPYRQQQHPPPQQYAHQPQQQPPGTAYVPQHPQTQHPHPFYTQQQQYNQVPPQQQPPQRSKPPVDLLTSPVSETPPNQSSSNPTSFFPSQPHSQHVNAPPPPPPNPEHALLLSQLSHTLTSQLHTLLSQHTSALQPLQAQHHALLTSKSRMEAELTSLTHLSNLLTTNTTALHTSLASADSLLLSLQSREPPAVDDILVAPTVVAEQLYRLVAEERGIAEAMFVLSRALDRGRVGGDVFIRAMRGLAREIFLKKVGVGKCARGLGLEMGG